MRKNADEREGKYRYWGRPAHFAIRHWRSIEPRQAAKTKRCYCASIEGVFHAVAEGCQRAVVPIENTLDGYVQVSLDGLLEAKARITGELYVPVQFA